MTCQLNKWVMAAAIAVTSSAQADTVVSRVGAEVILRDDARGAASTNRDSVFSLDSAESTLFFSNGTADPAALPPSRLNSVGGLVSFLNIGKAVAAGVDGAALTQKGLQVGAYGALSRSIVNVGGQVTAPVTVTGASGFSLVTNIPGGFRVRVPTADEVTGQGADTGGFNLTLPWTDGVLDGGTVTVKNLRVDLVNKQVFADVIGRPLISYDDPTLAYGDEVVYSGALWNIGAITGPTSLPIGELLAAMDGDPSRLTERGYVVSDTKDLVWDNFTFRGYNVSATTLLSKLTVTDQGFAAFASALGLVYGSTGYTTLAGVNDYASGWGTLKIDMKASYSEIPWAYQMPVIEVPEPETYLLMGIGLLGLAGAVRRHRGV